MTPAPDGRPTDPDRSLRAFAGSVGDLVHEFNNALTTVLGLADWHLATDTPGEVLREDLHRIRAAALAAEQTARQIQRLARAATGVAHRESQAQQVAGSGAQAAPVEAGIGSVAGRVVLVDDQPDVRASLSVMIRTLGYDVHVADGGIAALAALEREPAAAVVTDLGMPGMDGRALAEAVRLRFPGVPVVLLTGWAESAGETCANVARVLPKPLRMSQLREALSSVVDPARHRP